MSEFGWVIVPLFVMGLVGFIFILFGVHGSGGDQANVEYFFRIIYDCLHGACAPGAPGGLFALLSSLWFWITLLGYLIALIALVVIVYCTLQLFELRKREKAMYGQIMVAKDEGAINPRWAHIQGLMESLNPSDWRQAIIEADIMLGDMLTRQGYRGASIGDQLKQVDPADFDTLQDAWDAHKVRNDIAHQGSSFDLSQVLAQRTIAKYERVFREFDAI